MLEKIVGESIIEGLDGIGAIVWAILGLIGILPVRLASIAVIAIGLLIGGGTVGVVLATRKRLKPLTCAGYSGRGNGSMDQE